MQGNAVKAHAFLCGSREEIRTRVRQMEQTHCQPVKGACCASMQDININTRGWQLFGKKASWR